MKDREEYISILEQDNAELKKQLEEINKFKFSYKKDETKIQPVIRKQNDVEIIKNLENQQKEFIEYLENMICVFKKDKRIFSSSEIAQYNANLLIEKYEEILSKYKEIIGGKDDKEKRL